MFDFIVFDGVFWEVFHSYVEYYGLDKVGRQDDFALVLVHIGSQRL